jgi:hypothetical protein
LNDGLEHRFYLAEPVPEVDDAVPFIISECLFNLRSALDQLVYQLHVRRFRGRVPPKVEKASAFPILGHQTKNRDPNTWPQTKDLGKREQLAIKQYQPFMQRNDDLHETRAILDVLGTLNNIDKHRRLYVARAKAAPVSKRPQFPEPALGFRQTVWNIPLSVGALVETWTFAQAPPPIEEHQVCWAHVVIAEPTLDAFVFIPEFLQQALGHVSEVVRRFNTLFGYEPWKRWRSNQPAQLQREG